VVTSSKTLRKLIHRKLEENKMEIINITDIYKFVQKNCLFDDGDLIPPNLHGKSVKEPRWKRNVRNVLKSETDNSKIIWNGRGLYSYYGVYDRETFGTFSFDVIPKKTFFGLDKSKAHCFVIPKIHNIQMKSSFSLSNKKLQENIYLLIDNKKYPAIIRLVIMDRSKTRKLKREDLPSREVVQLSWISYKGTQNIIKNKFIDSFNNISKGKNDGLEFAEFKFMKSKTFRVSLIQNRPKDEEKTKGAIQSITCNIPSSFVNRSIKLANDRGHGEAKLYLGSVKDAEFYDLFFNNWHPLNNYSFEKPDILLYFQDVEVEFVKQSKYKNVSKKLYYKLMSEIESIDDLRVDLSGHKDSKRYYIRGTNKAWKLLRKIALPLITKIELIDISNVNSEYQDYKIIIKYTGKETMVLSSIRENELKIPKRTGEREILVKKTRKISYDLKDRVWGRDRGMCQANFRLDSKLDKNSGEICGSNENIEYDHIVPFSKGGLSTYRNLQLLCQKHNRIKSNKEI